MNSDSLFFNLYLRWVAGNRRLAKLIGKGLINTAFFCNLIKLFNREFHKLIDSQPHTHRKLGIVLKKTV